MKIFELRNVSYRYPTGDYALKNVNMDIYEGERVAIVGPNGAGKTTLLQILDGLIPAEGYVKAFDMVLDEQTLRSDKMFEFRKKVGLVFQDPDIQLFSPTVFDDIAFGPLHMDVSKEEVVRRVEKALKLMGIEKLKDKHPYNLSGGEKRKAAIATVLSIDPNVILLDEPTADLDPKSKNELIEIMNALNEEGKTIVIATHDIDAIPKIADRVYVINKTVLACGTPRDIFTDIDLLKKANLEIPQVMKLFRVLECFGYNCEKLPLSIDDAIEELTKTIETEGGHIHLHIHEHTHSELKKLKSKFDHH